jgi:hypothetical protein
MKLNNRTTKVLVVLAIIVVVSLAIAHVSAAKRTEQCLKDLTLPSAQPDAGDTVKIMDAISDLRQRGASVGPQLATVVTAGDVNAAPRAAWLLGLVGSHAGDQALVAALNSQNLPLRTAALQSLGELRVVAAEPAIAGCLGSSTQKPEVRASAAYALGLIGGEQATMALGAELADRPAPVPATLAAPVTAPANSMGLSPAPGGSSVPAIKPAAPVTAAPVAPKPPPDTTSSVRVACALALGQTRLASGASALLETLDPVIEPNAEVRVAAAYSLGDIAGTVTDEEHSTSLITGLIRGLSDKIGDVRVASAYALGRVSCPKSLAPRIQTALAKAAEDSDYWTRAAAVQSRASMVLTD